MTSAPWNASNTATTHFSGKMPLDAETLIMTSMI